jgi:hypothetical protein
MGINYSTAKCIIRLYKTDHLRLREPIVSSSQIKSEETLSEPTTFPQTSSYREYSNYTVKKQ